MEREELEAILKRIKRLGELAADRLGIIRRKDAELATLLAENERLREALVEISELQYNIHAIAIAKEALK